MKNVLLLGAASAAILALVSACGSDVVGGVSNSCVAPRITVSQPSASAGQEVEITGEAFLDGCGDAVSVIDGKAYTEEIHPLKDLEVVLKQSGSSTVLGTVSADEGGSLRYVVTVPDTVKAGTATITVGVAEPVTVEVVD